VIQPPADFVALFQQVLAWLIASTFLPLVSIVGAGVGLIILSWIFKPFASLTDWFKRSRTW
jgi:hypothetical protein